MFLSMCALACTDLCVRFWAFKCLCAWLCMGLFALMMSHLISSVWQRMPLSHCCWWMPQIQAMYLDVCLCACIMYKITTGCSEFDLKSDKERPFLLYVLDDVFNRIHFDVMVERSRQGKDVDDYCWFRVFYYSLWSQLPHGPCYIFTNSSESKYFCWSADRFDSLTHNGIWSNVRNLPCPFFKRILWPVSFWSTGGNVSDSSHTQMDMIAHTLLRIPVFQVLNRQL